MLPGSFDAGKTWQALLRLEDPFSVFMAVPTVYNILAKYIKDGKLRDTYLDEQVKEILLRYRLMVSGSAALPETQMEEWKEISGQKLLERFGMTEILMALSNPYRPIDGRLKGTVGKPLPGVSAALFQLEEEGLDSNEMTMLPNDSLEQGELLIKSTSMFDRYLNKPEATAKEFLTHKDGQRWFKTGDCAKRD